MDIEKPGTIRKIMDLERETDEMQEGIQFDLENLLVGGKLEVDTKNTRYTIERREDGFYISGNLEFCPTPTKAVNIGTTMGGSAIADRKVLVDGLLEYTLQGQINPWITSPIQDFVETQ